MNDKLQKALAIVEKYGMKGDVIYKEIEALAASKQEHKCACSMRTKLVGDGCAVCNPELADDLSKQEPQAKPAYQPDNGPLTDKQIAAIKKAVSKPEPQAQAGEPEVHVTMDDAIAAGDGTLHGAIEYWQNQCAKKDAALKACVEVMSGIDQQIDLSKYPSAPPNVTLLDELHTAISQAEEAMK